MLLTLAGKSNNNGLLTINEHQPYTPEMIATVFNVSEEIIKQALNTFEKYEMIEIINGIICLKNWDKHQHSDNIEKAKEQNRIRQQRYRERQKEHANNITSPITQNNVTVTHIDKDIDKDKEYNNILSTCVDEFNSICKSFSKVSKLTEKRKKAIKNLHDKNINLTELFKKSESSDFLTGRNGTWTGCSFDWLMNYNNAIKVIEGNYDNKRQEDTQNETKQYGGTYI